MKAQFAAKILLILVLCASPLWIQSGVVQSEGLASPIFVNANVNDGLAAHWKLDETGSATALDFVGTNPAALQDTASMGTTNRAPLNIPNPASLTLDGINDYAQVNALSPALALSTSFTVSAWIRRATTGTYDAIYDSGSQVNKWWIFIADGSAGKVNQLGFGERGISEVYSTQAITNTAWHHIAVVKNGDVGANLSFFVDGVASGTAAVGAVTTPSGSARIGALLDGIVTAQFGGDIDDLRIYNRPLTPAEVTRLALGQGCVTDGASWGGALRELQCALSSAAAGQDIWLAGGLYRPGTNSLVNFKLVNGVNLLGGFSGSETLAGQRPVFNPNAVLTNLTGDILNNDTPATFTNYAENTKTVVVAGAGVSATLDGLAIRQGNNTTGACLQVQAGAVGLTLTNVVVNGCSATGNGGGIHNQAPLTLNNVTLAGNRSTSGNGGGLFSSAAVTAANLQVLNNSAVAGGGIQLSAAMIVNGGLFDGNQVSTFEGGGIKSSAPLTINSVTFNNNLARFGGGAIESAGATLTIATSIFTNNTVTIFTGGAVDAPVGAVTITSSSFTGNTSTQDGGAIFIGSGSLDVQGGSFSANHANGGNCLPVCSSGSGGAIASLGSLNVSAATFTNNTARLDGGAVSARGPGNTISNSTFTGNQAGFPANAGNPGLGRGGAIFAATPLTLNSGVGTSNGAQSSGGAIYAAGSLNMTLGTYQINTAVNGGALFAETGGTVSDVIIMANNAGSMGGGVTLGGGTLTLTNSTFTSNYVTDPAGTGGGLNIITGTANITGGTFGGNAAPNGAGLFNAGTLSTSAVTFFQNSAAQTGGGIHNVATMTDNASTFDGNDAVNGGGVAFAAGDTTSGHGSFTGSLFSGNSATRGGGLHSINDVTLTNVTFSGNQALTATGDGGGLFTSGGSSNLNGVTFSSNSAGRFGGAARLFAGVIQHSHFFNNTAAGEGGGILLSNTSDIFTSVFSGNTSNLSGAIAMQGLPDRSQVLRVFSSLFYDNHRISTSGAADMRLFDLTISLVNNTFGRPQTAGERSVDIFRSNLAAENNIWNAYQTSLTIGQAAVGTTITTNYNLFFNAPLSASIPAGTHDLTSNPQFANPLLNDFSLKSTSPAVNSGDSPAVPLAVVSDIANKPRFTDVLSVANTGVGIPPVDRGAYEFALAQVFLPLVRK